MKVSDEMNKIKSQMTIFISRLIAAIYNILSKDK